MGAIVKFRGSGLASRVPAMHAWRSFTGVVSLSAWFYAIAFLPLATAMTLNYMSSVWIAAFLVGGALLTWRPSAATPRPALQGPLVLTVLAGFAGVIMMLRPSLDQNQMFAGLIGLLSGIASAFAYMQVVALSRLGERRLVELTALVGYYTMVAMTLNAHEIPLPDDVRPAFPLPQREFA